MASRYDDDEKTQGDYSSHSSDYVTTYGSGSSSGYTRGTGSSSGKSGRTYRKAEDFQFKNSQRDGSCYIEWVRRGPPNNNLPSVSMGLSILELGGGQWSHWGKGGRPGHDLGNGMFAFPFAPTSRNIAAEKKLYFVLLTFMVVGLALSAAGFKLADDYLTRYEGPEAVNKNQANIYTAVRYFRWSLLSVGVLVVVVCFAAELWCFNERLGVWKKTHVGGASIQLKNWWALAAYEAIYVYQLGALIVWCCWIFNNGIESPFHNPNRNEKLRQRCSLGTDSMCNHLKDLSKLLVVLGFVLLLPVGILGLLLIIHPRTVQQRLRVKIAKRADLFSDRRYLLGLTHAQCQGDVGMALHGGGTHCNVQPTRIYNVPHTMNDGEEGKAVALCDAHRRGWAAFTGNTGFQEPIDDRHGHGGHRGHGRSRHDDYNDYEPSHR